MREGPASTGADVPTGRSRSLARAGGLLVLASALTRLVSLGKEVYVAGVMGTGTAVDAYSLAVLVPWVGMALFVNGLRPAFQNRYALYEREGPDAATRFANLYVTHSLAVGTVGAVIAVLVLPGLLPLASRGNAGLSAAMSALVVPAAATLPPMIATTCLTALLNVRRRFAWPQLTAMLPAVVVAGMVATTPDVDATTLVWGMAYGFVVQSLVLLAMTVAIGHRWGLAWFGPGTRVLWTVGGSLVAVSLFDVGLSLTDRTMSSGLPEGSLSVLHWSSMLRDFFVATVVASVSAVLIPELGRQAADRSDESLRRTCSRLLRLGTLLVLPISSWLVVAGPLVLSLAGYGALENADGRRIGLCLAGYAYSLPGALLFPLLLQVLVARGRTRTVVLLASLGSLVPNVILNALLIGPYGVVGVAVATSLTSTVAALLATVAVRRVVGLEDEPQVVATVATALVASTLATVVGALLPGPTVSDGSVVLAILARTAVVVLAYATVVFAGPSRRDAVAMLALFRVAVARRGAT